MFYHVVDDHITSAMYANRLSLRNTVTLNTLVSNGKNVGIVGVVRIFLKMQ